MSLKTCVRCCEALPWTKFRADRKMPDGLKPHCTYCGAGPAWKPPKERTPETGPKFRSPRAPYPLDYSDPKTRATMLVAGARTRASAKGIPFSLASEDILHRILMGRCEATGIKFDLSSPGYRKKNPRAPSLDQIVAGKGYTADNVRLVAAIYNFCKNEFDDNLTKSLICQMADGLSE